MIAGVRRRKKTGALENVVSTIRRLRGRMAAWRLRELVQGAAVM
jgi:hypothetical protein